MTLSRFDHIFEAFSQFNIPRSNCQVLFCFFLSFLSQATFLYSIPSSQLRIFSSRMMCFIKSASLILLVVLGSVESFTPSSRTRPSVTRNVNVELPASLPAPVTTTNNVLTQSFTISRDDIKPLFTVGEGDKEKVINAFGLLTFAISLATGPLWMLAMTIVDKICEMNEDLDPNRAVFDYTGKIWSRVWLSLSGSFPEITGDIDALREGQGACLYVANHASWLDIPVLCTVLDPVFKFIAKAELQKVPCIGQQLTGGHHIMIDREDRRSQLRTFKEGIAWLKKGVPLMAFPEGQRSPDGRLMDFKGGIFSMAMKAKVPIVPISLSHTHAIMPSYSLFPVQPGKGKLHVHVHEAIDPEGKTDAELAELVRAALLSEMPADQHPLPKVVVAEEITDEQTLSPVA